MARTRAQGRDQNTHNNLEPCAWLDAAFLLLSQKARTAPTCPAIDSSHLSPLLWAVPCSFLQAPSWEGAGDTPAMALLHPFCFSP